jgi:hypothetical protein
MFGWFSTKCPVDTYEKTWTERRLCWLADQMGINRLLTAEVILPTEDFFPDFYEGTHSDAEQILERLCEYMALDSGRVELEVCADQQLPGVAGHYEDGYRGTIRIAESQLADPTRLVATLAHELAHEILLGGGLLTPDVADHEWVTDLLPLFLGLGVFMANATLRETSGHEGNWSWWSMNRQGYLPSHMFGYAFALFAFMRQEGDAPEWIPFLRPDASTAVRQGLRYLQKTNDSLFHPESYTVRRPEPSVAELEAHLQDRSASVRLAALWEVRERGLTEPRLVAAITGCLADPDAVIPGEAARTLAALGPVAQAAFPQLMKALWSDQASTRAGAAQALGVLQLQPARVVPEVAVRLEDSNPGVVAAAAEALRSFAGEAESAVPRLLAALEAASIDCDQHLMETLTSALIAISGDPRERLRAHFADPQMRKLAFAMLREVQARAGASLDN